MLISLSCFQYHQFWRVWDRLRRRAFVYRPVRADLLLHQPWPLLTPGCPPCGWTFVCWLVYSYFCLNLLCIIPDPNPKFHWDQKFLWIAAFPLVLLYCDTVIFLMMCTRSKSNGVDVLQGQPTSVCGRQRRPSALTRRLMKGHGEHWVTGYWLLRPTTSSPM